MAVINRNPTYNLKVVIRETGIKPDTLRAWERRYGLPQPERTQGGHRLYSSFDIETIKWLMSRQEEGLSISRAVRLWNDLEAEGQDPLQAMAYKTGGMKPVSPGLVTGTNLEEVRAAWLSACLEFNEASAENILAQAFARYPLETVCLEVLQKGLAEIGELWYRGEASVQQEHFASALAMRRLDALVAAAPPPTRPGRVIVSCPPEEQHTFVPLYLTLMLRQRGWEVVYLGANVPLERLAATLQSVRPRLVVMTALRLRTAATLLEAAQLLKEERVPLAFGGRIFSLIPGLQRRIPGYFLGEKLDEGVQGIENLLVHEPPMPELEPVSRTYLKALEHLRDQQASIEAHVWDAMQKQGMRYEHLNVANYHLVQDIAAALRLGEMSYLQPEIDWIETFISNNDIPREMLYEYLRIYQQALEAHLDERGKPLIDWFAEIGQVFEDVPQGRA